MREEVYRLSDFCLKHGNCYGTLQARARGRRVLCACAGARAPACASAAAGARRPRLAPRVPPLPALQNEVRVSALRMLPPNAAEIANKHGGTNVAVTFPSPRGDAPAVQRLHPQLHRL